jgi:hypothetical protein
LADAIFQVFIEKRKIMEAIKALGAFGHDDTDHQLTANAVVNALLLGSQRSAGQQGLSGRGPVHSGRSARNRVLLKIITASRNHSRS